VYFWQAAASRDPFATMSVALPGVSWEGASARPADREEARKVAYAVARSPLVKTAFSAGDPNLGRLLAAIGYAGIADLDVDRIRMWLGDVLVAEHGGRAESYTEEQGQAVMDEDEITVRIDLQRGKAEATVYTCDLTHEYISINADYRS